MNNNIVLIGFMGVGKGTTARALSKKLDMLCLDTDDLIESAYKTSIKKIFKKHGEDKFRKIENELAYKLSQNVQNAVISTGGGFFKSNNLNKMGKVIFLSSSFEFIIKRLKDSKNSKAKFKKRPLLADLERAKELFNQREELYRQKADIIIDVENKSTKEIVKEIRKQL